MTRILPISLFIFLFFAAVLSAEEARQLEKIIVTPSRMQNSPNTGRSVTVLDAGAIEMSGYEALQDIIGNLGGIDIRRRSPEGVQSDVNIRGATFEQNTVLIDGIKMNDPQTGHFTFDLPLTSFDTEKVEILKGPASSLYGANSFGGVINIITKKPDEKRFTVDAIGGARDYYSGGASASYPVGNIKNRFSIEWNRARPYIPDTEFSIINLSDRAAVNTDFGEYDFFFGYLFKKFGANSFYSNLYPSEEEEDDARFFDISGRIEKENIKIVPKLFLRRHYDKFSLDKNRAGWQTNYHTNYTYGSDVQFIMENAFMDVAYGFELSEDRIFSTNLQKHRRGKTGVYMEISPHLYDKLYVNAGIRQDTFSGFDTEYSPSVNLRYALFEFLSVRSSIGRSYRIPTFTDLYYNDAANIGDENLKSESSWTYEAGMDYKCDFVNCSVGYFNRGSSDTIDWTRMNVSDPWRVSNIGSVETNGVEGSIEIMPHRAKKDFPVKRLFINYTGLDLFDKHDYLSKYTLDYLKQQISGGFEYSLFGFTNSWVLNYKKRVGVGDSVVVDMKLVKGIIKKKGISFEAFLEITNLFDEDYTEQSGIPMPGRWLKSGVRLEF